MIRMTAIGPNDRSDPTGIAWPIFQGASAEQAVVTFRLDVGVPVDLPVLVDARLTDDEDAIIQAARAELRRVLADLVAEAGRVYPG